MNCLFYAFYVVIVGLIRVYKWIEYRILLLFTPFLKRKALQYAESIGVVLHCPGDPDFKPGLTSNNCTVLIEKIGGKYDRIIHIKVNNNNVFARIGNKGNLGMGEAFMDGSWECYEENWEDVSELGTRMLENDFMEIYYNRWNKFFEWLELYAFNLQTRKRAFIVGKHHYDLGNDLYELMLDPWMQYTCAYWKTATNLNQAQLDKLDLIARKLDLKPGMRVLDLGCGWGTLCKYLAENYQVSCVGVTVSKEGVAYGQKICKNLPVEIRLSDYRKVNEKFDRVVSIGLTEHVGHWNYRTLMKVAERCLVDDGIFLWHSISRNHFGQHRRSDPWTERYVFPNGQIPSTIDIVHATKNIFVVEDWHNFGMDYAETCYWWRENFVKEWPKIKGKYGDDFFRMWIYYLSTSRSLFKSGRGRLWQIVFSKDGLKEYRAAR